MKHHATVGEQPNVPKRLGSHELNSHKQQQTNLHTRVPIPLLV